MPDPCMGTVQELTVSDTGNGSFTFESDSGSYKVILIYGYRFPLKA